MTGSSALDTSNLTASHALDNIPFQLVTLGHLHLLKQGFEVHINSKVSTGLCLDMHGHMQAHTALYICAQKHTWHKSTHLQNIQPKRLI